MTRAGIAFLAVAMATPASAGCRTVEQAIADLRAAYPARATVAEVQPAVVPAIAAWLESEGVTPAAGAKRVIQVAGDRGLGLIVVTGAEVCDGVVAVSLHEAKAIELRDLIGRYRELKGIGREYGA